MTLSQNHKGFGKVTSTEVDPPKARKHAPVKVALPFNPETPQHHEPYYGSSRVFATPTSRELIWRPSYLEQSGFAGIICHKYIRFNSKELVSIQAPV